MQRWIYRFSTFFFVLVLLAGCGVTVHPRLGTGGTDTTGVPGDGHPGPGPSTVWADARPMIDQVCRARGVRPGWVIIGYTTGGDRCPPNRDPDNPYTVAIVERITEKRTGTTMIVCADQAAPRGWVRERNQHEDHCAGARVSDDMPSTVTIRRVR